MTPEEFKNKTLERLQNLKAANLVYPVATKVHDDMTRRLFNDGKMGNGSQTGTYSTKEMYASKKQFKKQGAFKAQGKNTKRTTTKKGKQKAAPGAGVFANGNPRKSMYLSQGYKQLKEVQGYEGSFVNLTYSADLRNDFASKLAVEGESVVLRLSRALNKKKVDGLTKKYGATLFKHTEQEKQFFINEVTKKVLKAMGK